MDRRSTGGASGSWIVAAVALLGLCIVGRPAWAQPGARVTARVSADTVRIGERFRLTLAAERPAAARVHFPSADAGPFGALEVVAERGRGTRTIGDDRVVDSVSYEVATFALDRARLPALPIRVVEGNDTTTVATSPRLVRVASVVGADASGLRTGDPLAPFPRSVWPWVLWGVVGVALVGGGAYWWWRRQAASSNSTPEPRASEATPYDTARTRLRTLVSSTDLRDRDAVKPFYVTLSDILRTYLADALGVTARERTTREVVAELQGRTDLPDDATRRVEVVLERADLVKFAGVRPGPEASKDTCRHARRAIEALQEATQSLPIDAVASAETRER